VLAGLRVADAFDPAPQIVAEGDLVEELLQHLGRGAYVDLPVVDEERRLSGIITLADLGRIAGEHREMAPLLRAVDIASPAETVAPGDSLLEAIRKMGVRGAPSIPVVDAATGRLLGLVSRAHILALYERTVARSAATLT
jgi:CBS domain-containing protein